MDTLTCDTIFEGKLSLYQPRDGYRFSVDSLILAASVVRDDPASVMDVGCGVGVVGIAAAHHVPGLRVIGVEVQGALAQVARRNVSTNGLGERIEIVDSDIRELPRDGIDPVEFALMNPPYYPVGDGHLNPSSQRAAARHEVFGTLSDLLRASAVHLVRGGKIRLVYPAEELAYLMWAVRQADLKAVWLRPIHSFVESPAKFVLLDAQQSGRREMQIARGMVIFDAPGKYSQELTGILDGIRGD